MQRMVLTFVIAAGLGVGLIGYALGRHDWSLLQADFPCQEDELLGFSPASRYTVVCIHRDQLAGPAQEVTR